MSRTFFISDTHFNHKNILKYEPSRIKALVQYYKTFHSGLENMTDEEIENRIKEMIDLGGTYLDMVITDHDNMLVKNWNSVVKPSDTVWFLGDFGLSDREYIAHIFKKLNGHIRMIKGNHDNWSDNTYRDMGFEFVSKYPIVLKQHFILSHAPMPNKYCSDYYNIYGHVHSKGNNNDTTHSYCACVELNNFKPFRVAMFDKATNTWVNLEE